MDPKIIAVLFLLMCCSSSVSAFFLIPSEAATGPTGPSGPSGPSGPTSFSYVGEGGCHNDTLKAGNMCRANPECDYIGQQSNGCWHLLKSGGSGKTPSDYPNTLQAITPVSTTYKFVGEGGCTGPDAYQAVGDTCRNTSGCDTIGVQSNGCWHLLDSTGTGSSIGSYSNGIMSVE